MSGKEADESPLKKGLLQQPAAHHEDQPGPYPVAGATVGMPTNMPAAMPQAQPYAMPQAQPYAMPQAQPYAMPVAGVPVGAQNYGYGDQYHNAAMMGPALAQMGELQRAPLTGFDVESIQAQDSLQKEFLVGSSTAALMCQAGFALFMIVPGFIQMYNIGVQQPLFLLGALFSIVVTYLLCLIFFHPQHMTLTASRKANKITLTGKTYSGHTYSKEYSISDDLESIDYYCVRYQSKRNYSPNFTYFMLIAFKDQSGQYFRMTFEDLRNIPLFDQVSYYCQGRQAQFVSLARAQGKWFARPTTLGWKQFGLITFLGIYGILIYFILSNPAKSPYY